SVGRQLDVRPPVSLGSLNKHPGLQNGERFGGIADSVQALGGMNITSPRSTGETAIKQVICGRSGARRVLLGNVNASNRNPCQTVIGVSNISIRIGLQGTFMVTMSQRFESL